MSIAIFVQNTLKKYYYKKPSMYRLIELLSKGNKRTVLNLCYYINEALRISHTNERYVLTRNVGKCRHFPQRSALFDVASRAILGL